MIAFGDRALRFAAPADPPSRRAMSDALRAIPGIVDAVVAEQEAMIVLARDADRATVASAVAGLRPDPSAVKPKTHRVQVVYERSADLEDVARSTGLGERRVIDAHARGSYVVSFIGFMPGFAYLVGLDPRLVLPRRATPRPRVHGGSVAVAARYTGVYPGLSAGGWHIIGNTMWAPEHVKPQIADRVSFEPIAVFPPVAFAPPQRARVDGPDEVVSVQGFAHVVGPEKHGSMHDGVAPGGPLVASAFAKVGTPSAIEIFGSLTLSRPHGSVTIASGRSRVAYLGLRDPALPVGLRIERGDRMTSGESFVAESAEGSVVIPIHVGPDAVLPEVLAAFFGATFRVSATSNRAGVRLDGLPLPVQPVAADRASTPMIKGAIQLTPGGPIILGPDHPTTGGYPVIGVLRETAMDAFYTLPFNASVRFAPA